jgi:hypothetical protein
VTWERITPFLQVLDDTDSENGQGLPIPTHRLRQANACFKSEETEMGPRRGLDKFRLRVIEQKLASEIQQARLQLLMSLTETETLAASESLRVAMQRFTDFAARNVIPEDVP